MKFKPQLYLPNQMIVKRGDMGEAMYFIFTGEV